GRTSRRGHSPGGAPGGRPGREAGPGRPTGSWRWRRCRRTTPWSVPIPAISHRARRPRSSLDGIWRATIEHMFDYPCRDCPCVVTFTEQPGDATCPSCGLCLYVTDAGEVGAYPPEDWT